MPWTKEQNEAITTRDRSLIVSAAAGSGKTAVLVERLMQILSDTENPVETDSIIVVTFTNDAAAQMKQRLTKKFSEKLSGLDMDAEPEMYDWLLQQRAGLSSAKISTISAFCFDLIRENADALGISPQFSIAEPEQAVIYQQRAMQKVMERWTKQEPDMEILFSYLCTREDKELEGVVLKLADYLSSQAFPQKWLTDARKACQNPEPLLRQLRRSFCEHMQEVLLLAKKTLPFAEAVMTAGDPAENTHLQKVTGDIQALQQQIAYVQSASAEDFAGNLHEVTFGKPNNRIRKNVDKDVRTLCNQLCDQYEKLYKKLSDYYLTPLRYFQADADLQKKLIPPLLSLTEEYLNELQEEKKRRNVLTFSDGEELAITLLGELDEAGQLHKTPLAESLSAQYRLIMVDEYQDSNNKQDCLFKLLSHHAEITENGLQYGDNVFLVGDVKQSIYSFRQANPANFRRAIASSVPLEQAGDGEMSLIYLNHNFRSAPGVLSFINALFQSVMTEECGEVRYDVHEQLNFSSPVYQNAGDIRTQVILPATEEDLPENSTLTAECIADTISTMLRNKVQVITPDGSRDCQPQDFCILLRSLKKVSAPIVQALRQRNIPVISDEDAALLELPEVRLIWNLLRIADNPLTDTAMAAVLLSPVCGMTADDLVLLRLYGKENDDAKPQRRLFRQMRMLLLRSDLPVALRPLQEKCSSFLSLLEEMRTAAEQFPLEECIQQIYDLTDLSALQSLYEDDELRRVHLDAFTAQAKSYREHADLTAQSCLSGWLRYLERLEENDKSLTLRTTAVQQGCVTIKTIHGSKGLEYPFVFAANLDKRFSTETGKSAMLADENGLFGLHLYDRARCLKYHTAAFQYLLGDAYRRQKSEEMRLFYVALTRARQQLFLILTPNKKMQETGLLLQADTSLSPLLARQASCMQDWVLHFLFTSPDAASFSEVLAGEPAGSVPPVFAACSRWTYHPAEPDTPTESQALGSLDMDALEQMRRQVVFPHDFPKSDQLSKYSVTTLAHPDAVTAEQVKIPEFIRQPDSDETLRGASRGTAVHAIMQYLHFPDAQKNPAAELERLRKEEILSETELHAITPRKLERFFSSSLYQRIAAAQASGQPVYKEKQFFARIADLNLPADSQLARNYAGTDGILIGTMDLIFREADGWVLVDYKTDAVSDSGKLLEEYSLQLWLYQKAAELVFGEPVKQAYLYSFRLDDAFEVPLQEVQC